MKFYLASSSEMFGSASPPQNEKTLFQPRSPYACAKLYSYWMTRNYREGYRMFAANRILFNHESPGAEKPLSREKSPGALPEFSRKKNNTYISGILMHARTGDLHPSTWNACGRSSSRKKRMIT